MMKTKRPTPKKKLQASARRTANSAMEDYEEEPSMRLSSAFVVVLLLHLVAVGGIYAFTRIKEHRASAGETPYQNEEAAVPAQTVATAASTASSPRGRVHEVKPGDTLIRIANTYGVGIDAIEKANGLHDVEVLRVGQEIRIPDAAGATPAVATRSLVTEPRVTKATTQAPSAPKSTSVANSGETYKVAKGDNPVAIARKFKVSYSDLIELNGIEDPRLLQIDQVLKIPKPRD